MKCTPVLLDSLTGPNRYLERIESLPNDEKTEKWLQDVLFQHPELLPVQEFDETIKCLIPIGREVATAAGYIDDLYITALGQLVIVETKLWKNPEKHRTVVAQIIDYAKEVSRWSYDDLNKAILASSRAYGVSKSFEEIVDVALKNEGISLSEFQERVVENLQNGEFLLLIVGDRISPNIALLTDAIHGSPGLSFTLGLVEIQLHRIAQDKDWPLLLIPDVVGKTVEVTRGVIKIQFEKEKPKVEVGLVTQENAQQGRSRTTREIFLQKTTEDLRSVYESWLDHWSKEKDSFVYWGTSGFSYRVKVNGKYETILDAYPEWAVSLLRETDRDRLKADQQTYNQYMKSIEQVTPALNQLKSEKKYVLYDTITADALDIILKATTDFASCVKDK